MSIVSNTSPIINLAAIGHLHLLPQMYGNIMIPTAVYHEIVVRGCGQPGSDALQIRAGFWISEQVYNRVIQMSGEDTTGA